MTEEEFAEIVAAHAREGVVRGVVRTLDDPPGRRPQPLLVELSHWWKGLDDAGKARVRGVAWLTAHHAVIAMLDIIDGILPVEDPEARGHFELRHVAADGTVTMLSFPGAGPMHELVYWTPPEL